MGKASGLVKFQKYFLSSLFVLLAIWKVTVSKDLSFVSVSISFVKPILIGAFLYFSTTVAVKLDFKSVLGLFLSFFPPYFINISVQKFQLYEQVIILVTYFYVSICFFISLFNLGRSFSIMPSQNKIKTSGMYSVVRHPLYSSYLSFFLITVILNLSWMNSFLLLLFFLGLYLRAVSEERLMLLAFSEYKDYVKNVPRFFSPFLYVPIVVCTLVLSLKKFTGQKNVIKIQIAYPVFSTNPLKADDWSSFFVINHIYPRVIEEPGEFRKNTVISNKVVVCEERGKSILSSSCKRAKVVLTFREGLKLCNGIDYTFSDFSNEFGQITNYKNWLFPGLKHCVSHGKQLCFTLENNVNINHALRSIYLRFGWSKEKNNSTVYGIAPNCFYPETRDGDLIHSGKIVSSNSEMLLSTVDHNSDVYLYGNRQSDQNLENLNYYNPIYYFLITSGAVNSEALPWKSEKSKQQIRLLFESHAVVTSNYNADLLSNNLGMGLLKTKNDIKKKYVLVIPDYLNNCNQMAQELYTTLNVKNNLEVIVRCENISAFVENYVKKKGHDWDAYISPLTPGLPGNEALQIQYFSPKSNESWLGKNRPEFSDVFLIGSSEGKVQVRPGLFCSIKPNPLGLSDLTFDDFIRCN